MTREQSFSIAFEEKKNELARKNAKYQADIALLASENPRLNEINSGLSALGARLAITAISGDTKALSELKSKLTALSSEREQLLSDAGICEVSYDCALCQDTGYINGKICDCIKSRAKAVMMESLSKSLPLDSCSFENFDLKYYANTESDGANPRKRMTEILKLCREYALQFDPLTSESLLFLGNTGLGKTHLSLAIVGSLLNRGFNVIYGSAYNLFSDMESEHFSLHTNQSYEAAISCDLLVIDDLGGEFVSPYIQSLLYNIVNTRLLAHKPTIINTNLSMAEIAEKYTPRVASRLMGEYVAKRFCGNDIRQIKAMQKK